VPLPTEVTFPIAIVLVVMIGSTVILILVQKTPVANVEKFKEIQILIASMNTLKYEMFSRCDRKPPGHG
jgi:hypothetical protein